MFSRHLFYSPRSLKSPTGSLRLKNTNELLQKKKNSSELENVLRCLESEADCFGREWKAAKHSTLRYGVDLWMKKNVWSRGKCLKLNVSIPTTINFKFLTFLELVLNFHFCAIWSHDYRSVAETPTLNLPSLVEIENISQIFFSAPRIKLK